MWRYAAPIRRASDSPAPLAFASSSTKRRTPDAQRPTPNLPRDESSLGRARRYRFVNCADHCPDDHHLDQTADAAIKNQFSGNGLDGVKTKAHADRCDFQQHTEPDPRHHATPGETGRIDHYERKNNQGLAGNDPVKQTHHFSLRPPEIWRFNVNILEEHAIQQPAPEKYKNVCGDECQNESLHGWGCN